MSDNEYDKSQEREPRDRGDRGDRDFRDKDREGGDDKFGGRGRGKPFFKKKVCKICTGKVKIDYKDIGTIRKFVSDRGKILPRRITGTCAKHQRKVSQAVKRARVIAILPYVSRQG